MSCLKNNAIIGDYIDTSISAQERLNEISIIARKARRDLSDGFISEAHRGLGKIIKISTPSQN